AISRRLEETARTRTKGTGAAIHNCRLQAVLAACASCAWEPRTFCAGGRASWRRSLRVECCGSSDCFGSRAAEAPPDQRTFFSSTAFEQSLQLPHFCDVHRETKHQQYSGLVGIEVARRDEAERVVSRARVAAHVATPYARRAYDRNARSHGARKRLLQLVVK